MKSYFFVTGCVMMLATIWITAGEITKISSKDTQTIKNKLEAAEQHVRELTSKLDTVSNDAGRAKKEIHSTLLEAWKIVDLLGQDRCGEVGEKYRRAQIQAEKKVIQLEDELKKNYKKIEELKLDVLKKESKDTELRNELQTEKNRRHLLETEVNELKDKLHWASAISNDTKSYEIVAEKMQSFIIILNERIHSLSKIQELIMDEHKNYMEWKNEMTQIAQIVKDAEKNFVKQAGNAASESMKRYVENLEKRLQDVVSNRDAMQIEISKLRKSMANKKISSVSGGISKDDEFRRLVELRKYADQNSMNSIGFWTLVVVTFCCGMLLARYLSIWQDKMAAYNEDEHATDGMRFTPGGSPSRGSTPGSGFVRARYSNGTRT